MKMLSKSFAVCSVAVCLMTVPVQSQAYHLDCYNYDTGHDVSCSDDSNDLWTTLGAIVLLGGLLYVLNKSAKKEVNFVPSMELLPYGDDGNSPDGLMYSFSWDF